MGSDTEKSGHRSRKQTPEDLEEENAKLWRAVKDLKKKIKRRHSTSPRHAASHDRRHRSASRNRRNKKRRKHKSDSESSDKDDVERRPRGSSHRSRRERSVSSSSESSRTSGSHVTGRESSERRPREASYSSRHHQRASRSPSHGSSHDRQGEQLASRQTEKENIEDHLDESVLELLGEDNSKDKAVGPPIHAALAERWKNILQEGLSKEVKQNLMTKYPITSNCQLLRPPLVNPEVKSAMNGISLKKDGYQMLSQNALGTGITALGAALTEVLHFDKTKEPLQTSKVISFLGDAGRILTDLHHALSMTRRFFITPGLNPLVKTIAAESTVGTLLFGDDFAEKIKSVKAVENSSKDLAKTSVSRRFSGNDSSKYNTASRSKHQESSSNLNWKGPPKRTYKKPQRGGGNEKSRQSSSYERSSRQHRR